jgi:hypothetical protein
MKWKNVLFVVAAFVCAITVMAPPAKAWNCPTGQHRVQAPAGTPTTAPYYDVVEGIAFICEPDTPTTPTTPSPSTQNQSQNQQQNQSQSQNSTTTSNSNATGGNSSSTANGGSSVLKNVGNSTLTNSGNSSNKNVNTATGGAGGSSSSQLTSTTSSQSSAQNNGNNSNNSSSTYNEVRQNPGAYAPTNFNTAPCTKGFSGGASTPAVAATLGIATTDKGCDSRQTAVIFHGIGNDFAAAKILCSTSASKRAKLTLTECLNIVAPAPVVIPAPIPAPAPTVIVVPTPAPVAAIIPPTQIEVPKVQSTGTLVEIGECKLVNGQITNVCKRILDDAILRLNNLPNSNLRVTGPIEATQAVKYLKSRVSPSRVEYTFSDDQNATVAFEIWSAQ